MTILLLAGVAATLFFGLRARPVSEAGYRTAAVERGTVITEVLATGTVTPVAVIKVSTQVSGQIASVVADFNDEVRRGQLLIELDAQEYQAVTREAQADLDVARAELKMREASLAKTRALLTNKVAQRVALQSEARSAEARLQDARGALERNLTLVQSSMVSDRELEQSQASHDSAQALLEAARARMSAHEAEIQAATAEVAIAEAQLENARAVIRQRTASLEQAEINLRRTQIRAPIDGIVIRRNVEVGQTVAASLQAPTLLTLAGDLTQMRVETRVDEADIGRVRPGQGVSFSVDAYPGERFSGTLESIYKDPEVVQNVVTYTVIVKAANPELLLFPGMTAVVRVVVDEKRNTLKIPNAALRFTPAFAARDAYPDQDARAHANRERVWVLDAAGRPSAVGITAGSSDDLYTAVVTGPLHEGQKLIVGHHSKGSP